MFMTTALEENFPTPFFSFFFFGWGKITLFEACWQDCWSVSSHGQKKHLEREKIIGAFCACVPVCLCICATELLSPSIEAFLIFTRVAREEITNGWKNPVGKGWEARNWTQKCKPCVYGEEQLLYPPSMVPPHLSRGCPQGGDQKSKMAATVM